MKKGIWLIDCVGGVKVVDSRDRSRVLGRITREGDESYQWEVNPSQWPSQEQCEAINEVLKEINNV